MDELGRRLTSGPSIFPHALDRQRDMLLLVELSEAELAQASFLDQRVLHPDVWGRWIPLNDVQARLVALTRDDAHYIFHIGHVGSTLISRLIGQVGGTLSLREPLLLRDLAALVAEQDGRAAPRDGMATDDIVGIVRRLLSRCFRPDQRAIIKATSFVSEIAAQLIAPAARALFVSASLESYMATILAGANSRRETDLLTARRIERLVTAIPEWDGGADRLDEGARVALAWLVEMLSLQKAEELLPPGAVLRLDFDAFLEQPAILLRRVASHFGLTASEDRASAIIASDVMSRYSKAPEHRYSADLRRQLQTRARHEHRETILRGLKWFNAIMHRYPDVLRKSGPAGTT